SGEQAVPGDVGHLYFDPHDPADGFDQLDIEADDPAGPHVHVLKGSKRRVRCHPYDLRRRNAAHRTHQYDSHKPQPKTLQRIPSSSAVGASGRHGAATARRLPDAPDQRESAAPTKRRHRTVINSPYAVVNLPTASFFFLAPGVLEMICWYSKSFAHAWGGGSHAVARRSRGVVAPNGLVGGTEHQSPGDAMIICEDVHMWYGNFHVLRGVSTIVQRGEKVVICGPSGSGKSSFIRTLNRLETHQ